MAVATSENHKEIVSNLLICSSFGPLPRNNWSLMSDLPHQGGREGGYLRLTTLQHGGKF